MGYRSHFERVLNDQNWDNLSNKINNITLAYKYNAEVNIHESVNRQTRRNRFFCTKEFQVINVNTSSLRR